MRFALKREPQKNWPNRPESYTIDIMVNPTQKGTEMLFVVTRKTSPGLYENIFNSYKALRSKNAWSLLFSDDLVIFSHFKVSRADPGAEFPRVAIVGGSLTGVSKQQPLLSCYPENVGTNPIRGRSRLLVMGFWPCVFLKFSTIFYNVIKKHRFSSGMITAT